MELWRGIPEEVSALSDLAPDVAIVPEACEPSRLPVPFNESSTNTYQWTGRLPYKGLGAMAFQGYELELACQPDDTLEWVLPLRVRGPVDFSILAVWAMNHRASRTARGLNRNGPMVRALETYAHLFDEGPVIVAGDFNDSAIWDKANGARPFATTVELLQQRGLVSAYHRARNEGFGAESQPTIYWRDRTFDGPTYHIDYCFVPEGWSSNTTVEVGTFEQWVAAKHSDHVPLIVEFDAATSPRA